MWEVIYTFHQRGCPKWCCCSNYYFRLGFKPPPPQKKKETTKKEGLPQTRYLDPHTSLKKDKHTNHVWGLQYPFFLGSLRVQVHLGKEVSNPSTCPRHGTSRHPHPPGPSPPPHLSRGIAGLRKTCCRLTVVLCAWNSWVSDLSPFFTRSAGLAGPKPGHLPSAPSARSP